MWSQAAYVHDQAEQDNDLGVMAWDHAMVRSEHKTLFLRAAHDELNAIRHRTKWHDLGIYA